MKQYIKILYSIAFVALFTALGFHSNAQSSVGINIAGEPNPNAVLELSSPNGNQGFLLPKVSQSQRLSHSFVNALSEKENGMVVFDTTNNMFYFWKDTSWIRGLSDAQAMEEYFNTLMTQFGDSIFKLQEDIVLFKQEFLDSITEINNSFTQIENNIDQINQDITDVENTINDTALYFNTRIDNVEQRFLDSITNINSSISNIENSVTNLETSVTNVENTLNDTALYFNNRIDNIDTRVTNLETSVTEINDSIVSFSNHFIDINDSITNLYDSVAQLKNEFNNIISGLELQEVLGIGNDAANQRIIGLGMPVNDYDAVTKKYVDDTVAYIRNELTTINNELTRVNDSLVSYSNHFTEINDSLVSYSNQFTEINDSLISYSNQFIEINDSLVSYSNHFTEINDSLISYSDQFTIVNDSISNLYDSIVNLNTSITNITNNISADNDGDPENEAQQLSLVDNAGNADIVLSDIGTVTGGAIRLTPGTNISLANSGSTITVNGPAFQALSYNSTNNTLSTVVSATPTDPASSVDLSGLNEVGSLPVDAVPRWDGTELVNSTIWSDGSNVKIGVGAAPATYDYSFEVVGTFKTEKIYHSSDKRWKKNIKTVDNALEKVESLRGVTYEWRKDEFEEKHFSDGTQLGLIAQEVEAVVPEIVNTGSDGYKAVEYANLVALLIEAVKEQQQIINKQQNEIDALKSSNAELQDIKSANASFETQLATMQAQIAALTEALQLISPVAKN